LLQDRRLTRFWRGDDQPALSLPDRSDEVDHSHGDRAVVSVYFESQALFRVSGAEALETQALRRIVWIRSVERLDLQECQITLTSLRRPDLARNRIARAQVEAFDLRGADVDVIRPVEVVPILRAEESVPLWKDL
jgi:hypothetical protein